MFCSTQADPARQRRARIGGNWSRRRNHARRSLASDRTRLAPATKALGHLWQAPQCLASRSNTRRPSWRFLLAIREGDARVVAPPTNFSLVAARKPSLSDDSGATWATAQATGGLGGPAAPIRPERTFGLASMPNAQCPMPNAQRLAAGPVGQARLMSNGGRSRSRDHLKHPLKGCH